jgi:hypothetical protein
VTKIERALFFKAFLNCQKCAGGGLQGAWSNVIDHTFIYLCELSGVLTSCMGSRLEFFNFSG